MVYTNNIPQPSDNISTSQAQILGNFQFLADTSTRSGIVQGISSGGYYTLPNGLIIQYFLVSSVADNDTVDFLASFTTAVIGIWIQGITGSTDERSLYVVPGSVTLSDFEIGASATFGNGAYVLAIGY